MRTLILLISIIALASFSPKSKKEMYFFCTSRSMTPHAEVGKQTVLITPVKFIVADEDETKMMARAWGAFVEKECANENGCTSDLNYYFDEASAKKQFDNAKKRYEDTSRYIVKSIEFKTK